MLTVLTLEKEQLRRKSYYSSIVGIEGFWGFERSARIFPSFPVEELEVDLSQDKS